MNIPINIETLGRKYFTTEILVHDEYRAQGNAQGNAHDADQDRDQVRNQVKPKITHANTGITHVEGKITYVKNILISKQQ
ncbi:MAG TPA: hypothetical protein VFC92_03450 [Bacteroidales bacterium]|nr:hypothetical protein [Bacteroidales bacterium]